MKKRWETLEGALRERRMVRVKRRADPGIPLDGFVVGMSEAFVLLHVGGGGPLMALNGYAALPLYEVKKARFLDDNDRIIERVLALKGIRPQPQPDIFLGDFPGLLSSVNAHFPLISVYAEQQRPGTCAVGRVTRIKKKSVEMRLLDPAGRWLEDSGDSCRFEDITRVDFDGRYESAMWLVMEHERQAREQAEWP